MIYKNDLAFHLATFSSSYFVRINEIGKPVCEYYGKRLPDEVDMTPSFALHPLAEGRTVVYDDKKAPGISLNWIANEFSMPLKGDYGNPSLLLKSEKGEVFDFVYKEHKIGKIEQMEGYPTPHDGDEELTLILEDEDMEAKLELHYLIYEKSDVIGRYVKIINEGKSPLIIKKALSYQLCLENREYELVNFHGGWCNEWSKDVHSLGHIGYRFASSTGSSSDTFHPFFLIKKKHSGLHHGNCYGFNLVYSGNHAEEVEMNEFSKIRIAAGINSDSFEKTLGEKEGFITPLGVMAFSRNGENGVAHCFHRFVSNNVVPPYWAKKARPVLFNNWEGTYMDFDEAKIHSLAKKAKKLGMEMFVLDDGWFGKRNDDKSSLGDWYVNTKKLRHGIIGLSEYIHKMGMSFGLWFEPEMISEDSDLYRAHPEYAIQDGIHSPSRGRNQLVLDLTKKEVREYICSFLFKIIEEANIDYIKWDYNRTMSDLPKGNPSFHHDYILGLYEILAKVRGKFPNLLMENCASGGSRNDLGMFSYFDQGWVSDNTDSFQRCLIQSNMAFAFPQSVMANHVSAKTSNQLLRKTTFGTKFDVASMGILGYELDIGDLDPIDEKEITAQISFYKEHRELFQFGRWNLNESFEGYGALVMEIGNGEEAVVTFVNAIQTPAPPRRTLPIVGMDPNASYKYSVRPEKIPLHKFGTLLNMVVPVHVKEEGKLVNMISRHMGYDIEKFEGVASGALLNAGALALGPEWSGVGINEAVRIIGDFGARQYIFVKVKE